MMPAPIKLPMTWLLMYVIQKNPKKNPLVFGVAHVDMYEPFATHKRADPIPPKTAQKLSILPIKPTLVTKESLSGLSYLMAGKIKEKIKLNWQKPPKTKHFLYPNLFSVADVIGADNAIVKNIIAST